MGRWRPPAARAAPYITAAGYRRLEAELRALWVRRNEVVQHLAAAAAEGDRSENAEYQYRKKELREIDRRIGYLQRRMPQLEIVSERPADDARVFFGARVELEADDGSARAYRIVGADEAEPANGAISLDSPVAQRLLGRALDDEVELDGLGAHVIVDIDYPDPRV
ncbi:MAG: GreA/GreB family elongation factor [Gammaproteobacteria bacterium]|nr:GreA/GreB family elongation factor [Gammaproteobacteria bacterium]MCP5201108.1 GreA/GreB family elongation factor [Gammaproteobacteria bacterium]